MLGTWAAAASTARTNLRYPALLPSEHLPCTISRALGQPIFVGKRNFPHTHSHTYSRNISRGRRECQHQGRKPMSSITRASNEPIVENYVSIPQAGGYEQLKQVNLIGKGSVGANTNEIPEETMVLVKTAYVGVNYADVCIRWGLYESAKRFVGWPIIPGFEFSGIVSEMGDAVTDLKVGDKVFGVTMFGGYSSSILVPRNQVYLLPSQFSLQEAASFLTVALTAWYAMYKQYQPQPGDAVMIHSVAGNYFY